MPPLAPRLRRAAVRLRRAVRRPSAVKFPAEGRVKGQSQKAQGTQLSLRPWKKREPFVELGPFLVEQPPKKKEKECH